MTDPLCFQCKRGLVSERKASWEGPKHGIMLAPWHSSTVTPRALPPFIPSTCQGKPHALIPVERPRTSATLRQATSPTRDRGKSHHYQGCLADRPHLVHLPSTHVPFGHQPDPEPSQDGRSATMAGRSFSSRLPFHAATMEPIQDQTNCRLLPKHAGHLYGEAHPGISRSDMELIVEQDPEFPLLPPRKDLY